MDSEIGNIEAAECEKLLSSNVVQSQIYGSKEPVCQNAHSKMENIILQQVCNFLLFHLIFFIHETKTYSFLPLFNK